LWLAKYRFREIFRKKDKEMIPNPFVYRQNGLGDDESTEMSYLERVIEVEETAFNWSVAVHHMLHVAHPYQRFLP